MHTRYIYVFHENLTVTVTISQNKIKCLLVELGCVVCEAGTGVLITH